MIEAPCDRYDAPSVSYLEIEAVSGDFTRVDAGVDLPGLETKVLGLWDDLDAFAESVRRRPEDTEYTFYDGPPFATGSPHYGNLLAGVLKDIVPRYWTMRGHRVERRFGWDTHGLPIEMDVQRELGLSGPADVIAYGVDRFNEACREKVKANSEPWRAVTRRVGRWVDFDNDYKTLDTDYMESVWWVFKQLWDADLIYHDFKVLPYSWGAATPLSNFEAGSEYRDVADPSVIVRIQVTQPVGPMARGDWLLIWTTTPWTLPGNLAVAVGPDIDYSCVAEGDERHWVGSERIDFVWNDPPHVVRTAKGRDLVGAEYSPPFEYFSDLSGEGAFRIIGSEAVTMSEGTGLVHMAPAYGEDDFYAMQAAGLDVLIDPIDAEGRFTGLVPIVAGVNIKEADRLLLDDLKHRGAVVKHDQIVHSYPFCYRTHTPLMYKAIPTWFVKVEAIKDRMVELNKRIHWVPDHVGEKRFGNWLEGARDWAISRNRFWGSCIPVWVCDSCSQSVCIGSIDELVAAGGPRVTDLHKHIVDDVLLPCTECDGTMRRVPEVLDVWFESGSMPFAQLHYPFEQVEAFERRFPASFIAEGLDQTRGWFYTLLVLSTAIRDQEPFRNVVVNGMILAEDGRKLSKSLKNYADPIHLLEEYGADPLRAYLINSPLLRAEPLRFTERGVREVTRTVLLPLWNAYSFFTTYAEADGITLADIDSAPVASDRPEIDRWILSSLQSLIATINREMEGYYLTSVIGPTLGFIDDVTNWYVRRSRRRFWRSRSEDPQDKLAAFATLYEVLVTFSKVLAPILPFITESLYQGLVVDPGAEGPLSVHHADYPEADIALVDVELEDSMAAVRLVVRLAHGLRLQHGLRVRQPLAALTVVSSDPRVRSAVESHLDLIAGELNVKQVVVGSDEQSVVTLAVKANFANLGPRLGARVGEIAAALGELPKGEIARLGAGEAIVVAGETIGPEDVSISRIAPADAAVAAEGSTVVVLETGLTDDLVAEGIARDVISVVQQARREAELDVADRIRLSWHATDDQVVSAVKTFSKTIAAETLATEMVFEEPQEGVAGLDGMLSVAVERR